MRCSIKRETDQRGGRAGRRAEMGEEEEKRQRLVSDPIPPPRAAACRPRFPPPTNDRPALSPGSSRARTRDASGRRSRIVDADGLARRRPPKDGTHHLEVPAVVEKRANGRRSTRKALPSSGEGKFLSSDGERAQAVYTRTFRATGRSHPPLLSFAPHIIGRRAAVPALCMA